MLYKNDIANLALGYLGSTQRVSDFDNETSGLANILRLNFQGSLEDALQRHPWSSARGFKVLSLISNADVEIGRAHV